MMYLLVLIFYLQISEPVHVDSNSYTIDTNLIEDVEYYWKVVAIDDDGGQTESEVHSPFGLIIKIVLQQK